MANTDLPEGYTLDQPDVKDSVKPPEGYTIDETDPNAPPEGYQLDSDKYTTPGQQAKTVAENVAQGAAGPVATEFETSPISTGLSEIAKYAPGGLKVPAAILKMAIGQVNPEDITSRQQQNPGEALAGQVAGNIGQAAISPVGALASRGARALKGGIESGVITANDEISKAMLGQGDPGDVVAAKIAGSTGLGLLAGSLFGQNASTAGKELKLIQDSKIGSKLSDFLAGMGHNAQFLEPEAQKIIPEGVTNAKAFSWGQKAYDALHSKALATGIGWLTGKTEGTIVAPVIHEALKHIVGPQLTSKSQKYIAPALLKAAASGVVKNPSQILEHAASVTKGETALNNAIESVFAAGSGKAAELLGPEKDDKLKEHIENGGLDEQLQQGSSPETPAFAKGGEVKPMAEINENNEIANHWPEQNVMLTAAKARVSNYLSSLKEPSIQSRLPFDKKIKNKEQEREYGKAINLANNPLSILNHVKDGTLTPRQMKHFTSMYPELYNSVSKKMTKRLMEHQIDEETKPKYKTRQAMSLFLGSHLDSTLIPQNIQAAQMVFINQKAQKQAAMNNTSSLNKAGKNAMTDDQAREKHLNKD
jgi:hypothetical protein